MICRLERYSNSLKAKSSPVNLMDVRLGESSSTNWALSIAVGSGVIDTLLAEDMRASL